MKYKKKKYFKQNLDLGKLVLNVNLFLAFQLKAVDVSDWILFKKTLAKHNLRLKVYSTKLLKKNHFFNTNPQLVENLYTGKILIIYFEEKILPLNLDYFNLEKLISTFENKSFLVFLHAFFLKNFFSAEKCKNLVKICVLNSKINLIQLILTKNTQLLKLFNNNIAE